MKEKEVVEEKFTNSYSILDSIGRARMVQQFWRNGTEQMSTVDLDDVIITENLKVSNEFICNKNIEHVGITYSWN